MCGLPASCRRGAGVECVQDAKRGYDHGHFIPLLLMYPAADIPTVQLSLVAGLDPEVRRAASLGLRLLAD